MCNNSLKLTAAIQKIADLRDDVLAKYMRAINEWKDHLKSLPDALDAALKEFNAGVEPPINPLIFETLIREQVIKRFLEENQ